MARARVVFLLLMTVLFFATLAPATSAFDLYDRYYYTVFSEDFEEAGLDDRWYWSDGNFTIVPSNETAYGDCGMMVHETEGYPIWIVPEEEYYFSAGIIPGSDLYGMWLNFSMKLPAGSKFNITLSGNYSFAGTLYFAVPFDDPSSVEGVGMHWDDGINEFDQLIYYGPGWGSWYGNSVADGNWVDISIRWRNDPVNSYGGCSQPFARGMWINGTYHGFFYSNVEDFDCQTYEELVEVIIQYEGEGPAYIDNISIVNERPEAPPEELPFLIPINYLIFILMTLIPTMIMYFYIGALAVVPTFDLMCLVCFIGGMMPLGLLIAVVLVSVAIFIRRDQGGGPE